MKVGTRVRKVRGAVAIGTTGTVSPRKHSPNHDISICLDVACVNDEGRLLLPGKTVSAYADQWEPIVPEGHQPADETVEDLLPFLKGVTA